MYIHIYTFPTLLYNYVYLRIIYQKMTINVLRKRNYDSCLLVFRINLYVKRFQSTYIFFDDRLAIHFCNEEIHSKD